MALKLNETGALVTGASSGIGATTAAELERHRRRCLGYRRSGEAGE